MGITQAFFSLHKIYSLGLFYLIIQEITMGPPSPLQSPARSSQTWSTRFSLTRNLTPRSSENAPPRSVRWTEKTVQHRMKKRRRRSLLWSTVWPVRDGAVIIIKAFLILRLHFHSHHSVPTTNIPRISIYSHEVSIKSQMQSKTLTASLCQRVQDTLPVFPPRVPSRITAL